MDPTSSGGARREWKITCPAFKITSARLGYVIERKSTCPRQVQEKAKFKAAAPGQAQFEIKSRSGLVVHSGTAVFKREGHGIRLSCRARQAFHERFDFDMMALIKNDPAANSGWVRLKVDARRSWSWQGRFFAVSPPADARLKRPSASAPTRRAVSTTNWTAPVGIYGAARRGRSRPTAKPTSVLARSVST